MDLVRRWSAPGVVVALCALGASLGLQKLREYDYWWHARTGRWIAEHGAVPRHDLFTYTVPDNRWIDIHWLFQLGLHGARQLGGEAAVIVAKAVLVAALLAVLLPIGWRRERAWLSGLALGAMLLVAGDRFEPRPELPSFVLLGAVLALLDRHERRGGRAILWAIPLQLLWVNLHGLFALGLALLAIALAAEVLRPLVAPGESLRRERLALLAVALLGSIAVSLVNPNGIDGLLYPLQQLEMVGPEASRGVFGSIIAELLPPLGGERGLRGLALALAGGLAALSGLAMGLNWRRVSTFDPLVWVAFAYLALGAHRNVALFAIVAAPIAVRNANAFLDRHPPRPAAMVAANAVAALVLAAATADVVADRFFLRIGSSREIGFGTFDAYYPIGAVDWIERERPPGPIAHHMADGGYLIDRLWPDYAVMADGRLEVFGPETFAELQITGSERFQELDARYHFGAVLVHYSLVDSEELLWWLHLNPTWKLVYVDDVAALFVRNGDMARRWPEVDLDAPDLFAPLGGDREPTDRLRRQARVGFWLAMRRWKPALALWEETLGRYPDVPEGRVLHALLLQRNGFPAAAEAILREELARRPDDAVLHARIGELRQEAGDLSGARERYDRALAIDPNEPYALMRRMRLAESLGDLDGAAEYEARLRALSPDAGQWLGLAPP